MTLLAATPAHAYRPFDFTDADVAQRHHIELEVGPLEYFTAGREHVLKAPSTVLNYGVDGRRELVVEATRFVPFEEGPVVLRDVAVSYKQILRSGTLQDQRGPSMATEWALLVPTHEQPHAGASAGFITSARSPRGYAHFNVEVERERDGANALSTGIILERGDQPGVGPVLELEANAEHGETPGGLVLGGLVYVPRDGFEWDLAARSGWVAGQHIFEFHSGFTWQFSTHEAVKILTTELPSRRHRH